jgi:hypothetical protein
LQLGTYDIPEVRLEPDAIRDIKRIYNEIKKGEIQTNDLAKMLGYSAPNSGKFYSRISSLVDYGLLEGRGRYRVTQLGREISYIAGDEAYKRDLYKKAVFNVPLWKTIHDRYPDQLPENFWYVLKNITEVDAPDIHKVENEIRKRYLEDMALIQTDSSEEQQQKDYTVDESKQNIPMPSPQLVTPTTYAETETVALNINKKIFNIPVFSKESLQVAVAALNMLADKFNVVIEIKPKHGDEQKNDEGQTNTNPSINKQPQPLHEESPDS